MNKSNVFCQNDSSVSVLSFRDIWMKRSQQFTCRTIPIFLWNRSASILLLSFCCCFVTHLSWVSYSQHSAKMSNKMITAFYLQNNLSISLECWNRSASKLLLSFWYERKTVKHWNDDNNKTLLSSYLLEPLDYIFRHYLEKVIIHIYVCNVYSSISTFIDSKVYIVDRYYLDKWYFILE